MVGNPQPFGGPCTLSYIEEFLAVDEADLKVVLDMHGYRADAAGQISGEEAADVLQWLDPGYSRSTPGWYEPRESSGDDLGLGGSHL